jgi:hypothetical protein
MFRSRIDEFMRKKLLSYPHTNESGKYNTVTSGPETVAIVVP